MERSSPADVMESMKRIGAAIWVAIVAAVLAGCSAAPTVGSASSPTPQPSPTPSLSATSLPAPASPETSASPYGCSGFTYVLWGQTCAGRDATREELAAMLAVGGLAAEADLGLPDWADPVCTYPAAIVCFQAVDSTTYTDVGTDAGVFGGVSRCPPPPINSPSYATWTGCGAAHCQVFLYKDSAGWHYVNAFCEQAPGYVPGRQARVYVTDCANVREGHALSAKVLGCLGRGTVVEVDSAPVYQDGHIWWHLAGRGWMAHDFLVAPKKCNLFSQLARPLDKDCCWSATAPGCG